MKPFVTRTGTANEGTVAPFLGKVDISGSDTAYNFQVAVVGASGNQSDLKCNIRDDGRVTIEGVFTGTSLANADVLYEVKVQEFPPPGRFSISFNLPGPVVPSISLFKYEHGILNGTVRKFRLPLFIPNEPIFVPKGNH